jgi:hypothetical protein
MRFTGESQPMRRSPKCASQMFMPRVGTTVNLSRQLTTSTTSTPSCRPPLNLRRVTLHGTSPTATSAELTAHRAASTSPPSRTSSSEKMLAILLRSPFRQHLAPDIAASQ